MPLYNVECGGCDYTGERFLHRASDREFPWYCSECQSLIKFLPSFGRGLTYMRENNEIVIESMADEPVRVRSYKEHEDAMKKHGVALAPPRRGTPGCWS